MENFVPKAVKHPYSPTSSSKFLWWLSTAEPELLSDAVVDRNRQRIIGLTVMSTWLFATFSWTYFFSTVVQQAWIYALCGVFLGFVILVIDRALIKGINRFNKRNALPLLFRGLLALTIGTFMAQPAVLFIFNKDIQTQLVFDNQERIQQNREKTDSIYFLQTKSLLEKKQDLNTALEKKSAEVSQARNNYLAETDGSGGSGRVGIKEIALAKKAEYESLAEEYRELSARTLPVTKETDSLLLHIQTQKQFAGDLFEKSLSDGFLARVDAMNNLMKKNLSLQWRYYLIVVIFMLIELMPVIAKTILQSGTYDETAKLKEEVEIALARKNSEREFEIKNEFANYTHTGDLRKMGVVQKENSG